MTLIIVGAILVILGIVALYLKTHGEWTKTKCKCKKNKDCYVCGGKGFYYSWHLKNN